MKVCKGCGETKPKSDYYVSAKASDGLMSKCKPCICTYNEVQMLKRGLRAAPVSQYGAGRINPDWYVALCADAAFGKKCNTCGEVKPAQQFKPISRRSDLDYQCRQCSSEWKAVKRRVDGKAFRPFSSREELAQQNEIKRDRAVLARAERAAREPRGAEGSKEWYKTATHAEIIRYRSQAAAEYRERYSRNKDAELERSTRYKHANPHKIAEWGGRRKEAAARRADGTLTREAVGGLFAAAKACPYCERAFCRSQDKSLDHIIPLAKGGAHGLSNVLICCRTCNIRKGAKMPDEWLAGLEDSKALRQVRRRVERMLGGGAGQTVMALEFAAPCTPGPLRGPQRSANL